MHHRRPRTPRLYCPCTVCTSNMWAKSAHCTQQNVVLWTTIYSYFVYLAAQKFPAVVTGSSFRGSSVAFTRSPCCEYILDAFLLAGATSCSRPITFLPCPRLAISLRRPGSLEGKMVLETGMLVAARLSLLLEPRLTEQGGICCISNHVCTSLYKYFYT